MYMPATGNVVSALDGATLGTVRHSHQIELDRRSEDCHLRYSIIHNVSLSSNGPKKVYMHKTLEDEAHFSVL
jgi:hypothetical protein